MLIFFLAIVTCICSSSFFKIFYLAWILSHAILMAANPQRPCRREYQKPILRMIDGYETEIEERPFQVYLSSACGGSIIGSKWILSAAHCSPVQSVSLGSKLTYGGKKISVKNLIIHPSYNKNTLNYDMMLIELTSELVFDKNVQPILLDDGKETIVGKEAVASGWGLTEKCVNSENLLSLKFTIIDYTECQAALNSAEQDASFIDEKSMICASSPGSTFPGDSGGPLTVGSKLVGITSWVIPVDGSYFDVAVAKNFPAGFAKVSSARDWIRKMTGI